MLKNVFYAHETLKADVGLKRCFQWILGKTPQQEVTHVGVNVLMG